MSVLYLIQSRDSYVKKIISIIILGALSFCGVCFAGENAPMAVKAQKEETLPFWESYGDELLNGYIQEALENNLSIKIAGARIKESEAILGTINAQRLPQLSINPSVYPYRTISRWSGNFGSGNLLYFPLLLNWELDIFGNCRKYEKSAHIGQGFHCYSWLCR